MKGYAMSVMDSLKEAVGITPTYTSEKREEVRATARAAASSGDWLSMVLDHHVQLEQAFAAVKAAGDEAARGAAQKWLAVLLTGHANAEEAVLYPAMENSGQSGASHAYHEQAMAKTEMAALDDLPKMSQDYLDKLEEIRLAVQHHMIEEESGWFVELKKAATPAHNAKYTKLYTEEFERYVGSDKPGMKAAA